MPSESSVSCRLRRNIAIIVDDRDRHVGRDRGRRVGHHGLDAADVVRQPRLDLARPRRREEPQRHPLQVGVERVPQVLHHALADEVVEVRLPDADQPGHDRQDDHQPDVQVELVVLLPDDDVVDQQLEQVRVDEADEAGGDDRDQDDDDLQAVRPEERGDAARGAGAALRRDAREVVRRWREAPATAAAAGAAQAGDLRAGGLGGRQPPRATSRRRWRRGPRRRPR